MAQVGIVAARPRAERRRLALAALCAADMLVMLDGMVVAIALPAIQRDLGFSPAALQWVVTAYTVALGSFLLVGGRAADLFGRRRVLVAGMLAFSAGSLAAGLADTPAVLLTARAVQGLGAAAALPAALALLAATFRTGPERHRALGTMSATIDAGMVVGLIAGGVVTAALGWEWVFFLAVPAGLAAAALVPIALPESRDEEAPRRLDVPGSALVAAGCALLVLGFVQTEHHGLASAAVLGPLAGAAALLTAFVARERSTAAPVVRLGIFRVRRLTGANLAIATNAGGFTGMMFLSTLYLQRELGLSAVEAGLAFLPLAVSAGLGGVVAPRLVARHGARTVATVSLALTAAGFGLLALADGLALVLAVFAFTGFTFASAWVPLIGHGISGVREGEQGLASGLFHTSTQLGGAIELALLATAAAAAGFGAGYLTAGGLCLLGAVAGAALLDR
jgi:EmrB/QacA subfamily drug resistance transporter